MGEGTKNIFPMSAKDFQSMTKKDVTNSLGGGASNWLIKQGTGTVGDKAVDMAEKMDTEQRTN